jgi:hypothetical protein
LNNIQIHEIASSKDIPDELEEGLILGFLHIKKIFERPVCVQLNTPSGMTSRVIE